MHDITHAETRHMHDITHAETRQGAKPSHSISHVYHLYFFHYLAVKCTTNMKMCKNTRILNMYLRMLQVHYKL